MLNSIKIVGKVLVFTDLHLGLKSASKSRLAICINVIKAIVKYCVQNKIKTILFLGDWNHVRTSTENNVLNVSYKLMSTLAKHCNVYCIVGNHDIYMKNSTEINSLVIFNDIENVHVISESTEAEINGKHCLLVPWLGDMKKYEEQTFDMMFGHFDASHQYLVKSYVEDHMQDKAADEEECERLDEDELLKSSQPAQKIAGDFVGSFINYAKSDGTVFSGHIHLRKEMISKGRKFIFVGDPYQQNLGEISNTCGFYVLNEDSSYKFHEISGTPKHVQLKMSHIVSNIDKFDFSCVTGNIIHKVYDVEVDRESDIKISQKIADRKPYEELIPEYAVNFKLQMSGDSSNSIELIKKSKFDYVKNYVANIDDEVLENDGLEREKLLDVLKKYYVFVSPEDK